MEIKPVEKLGNYRVLYNNELGIGFVPLEPKALEMTAKEMFEKLGYEYYKYIDSIVYTHICTFKDSDNTNYTHKYIIDFIENDELGYFVTTIEEVYCNGYFEYSTRVAITMDLLKAINKQIEELGWLNDSKRD